MYLARNFVLNCDDNWAFQGVASRDFSESSNVISFYFFHSIVIYHTYCHTWHVCTLMHMYILLFFFQVKSYDYKPCKNWERKRVHYEVMEIFLILFKNGIQGVWIREVTRHRVNSRQILKKRSIWKHWLGWIVCKLWAMIVHQWNAKIFPVVLPQRANEILNWNIY